MTSNVRSYSLFAEQTDEELEAAGKPSGFVPPYLRQRDMRVPGTMRRRDRTEDGAQSGRRDHTRDKTRGKYQRRQNG